MQERPMEQAIHHSAENKLKDSMSIGKLIFLGIIAMALSSFGPLALFSPVPLALAFLLYGFGKTLMMATTMLGLLLASSIIFKHVADAFAFSGIYFLAIIYALTIALTVVKKQNPVKGLLKSGITIYAGIILILVFIHFVMGFNLVESTNQYVKNYFDYVRSQEEFSNLVAAGGEQAQQLKSLVEKPQEIVTAIFSWLPSTLFAGVFIGLWVNLMLILRNSLVWRLVKPYPFHARHLTAFKVPEFVVWLLIAALTCTLYGVYGESEIFELIGGNLIVVLSVLYFFQGYGVYSDALDFFQVFGLLRTMLTVTTLFMAWKILILIGVFDYWVNFRKFLKKDNKGV